MMQLGNKGGKSKHSLGGAKEGWGGHAGQHGDSRGYGAESRERRAPPASASAHSPSTVLGFGVVGDEVGDATDPDALRGDEIVQRNRADALREKLYGKDAENGPWEEPGFG